MFACILAAGELGSILPLVYLLHKFKGRGLDPGLVQSFRPLGLADGLWYRRADLAQLRTVACVTAYVGPHQLGGRTDSRFLAILHGDARAARAAMKLPITEASLDARFGFDGGRHSQLLVKLH